LNNTTGTTNTAVGADALLSNVSGQGNTASGFRALRANDGTRNTAHGFNALRDNQGGDRNTGIGANALRAVTTGSQNTALGNEALLNNSGSGNIAFGASAGSNLGTGDSNIMIGNAGVAAESNTIRIGTSGTHTATLLAGDIIVEDPVPGEGNGGPGRQLVFEGNRSARIWLDDDFDFPTADLEIARRQADLYFAVNSGNKAFNFGRGSSRANFTRWMVVEDGNLSVAGTVTIGGGADLSEGFDIRPPDPGLPHVLVEPGTVVCIDPEHPGQLARCERSYDRTVAGIVSGAGGVQTGMRMGQAGSIADGESPVALTGRVYVKADATGGPIVPGDLLTTADLPGYAQRVSEHNRAVGAILGKAMTGLDKGQDLVLVLVSLQ
jgi:hypothetical protein